MMNESKWRLCAYVLYQYHLLRSWVLFFTRDKGFPKEQRDFLQRLLEKSKQL